MNKILSLTIVIIAVLALIGSAAMAMAPLGPPTSDLKEGQFGVGAEYAYTNAQVKIEDEGIRLKTNMFLANVGYGVMDDWKGYILVGAGDARTGGFAGDDQFALGWGTKYTFLKQDNLDWGAMLQMSWLESKGDVGDQDGKVKPYEAIVAVGPTYKLSEDISIFGGGFLQWIRGDAELGDLSADIEEKNMVGGYGGAQFTLCENTTAFGELQIFGTGWGIGTGITWKF